MKKKLLVSLLVLSMVLCLLPVGASADGIVGTEFNTVSTGYCHAAAIDSNGGLWIWGCNEVGQLGNGGAGDIRKEPFNELYQSTPVKIMDDVVSVDTVKSRDVLNGMGVYAATAAIKSDGSLWVWGNAGYIGTGGKGNAESNERPIQNVPIKLMDNVASVSMGCNYNFAVKTDGALYCWGRYGTPVKIMDDVISVSAGEDGVAVIKSDNSLWVCEEMPEVEDIYDWENKTYNYISHPEKIKMKKVMDDVASVKIGSGRASYSAVYFSIAAIKTDGSLWMWGVLDNKMGDTWAGNLDIKLSEPVKVMDKVLSVSVFSEKSLAVKPDNTLWEIQFSYIGDLSQYDLDNPASSPDDWSFTTEKVMDGVSEVSFAPIVFAGASHIFDPEDQLQDYTVVKKTDGSVWAWGYNEYYCVGNGGKGEVVKNKFDNEFIVQKTPEQIIAGGTTPPVDQPTVIETTGTVPDASGRAYANTQTILVDGKAVTFETYALHDSDGYPTNYIKLRDLAYTINGTKAQFDVVWDGSISLNRGVSYKPNGSEMETPFSGDRDYKKGGETLTIDGKPYTVQCFMLFDDLNDGYTYYKLRDLGMALGFNVGWDTQTARVFIETDKPYTGQ